MGRPSPLSDEVDALGADLSEVGLRAAPPHSQEEAQAEQPSGSGSGGAAGAAGDQARDVACRPRLEAKLDAMLVEFVLKAKREQRMRQLYPPPLDIGW